MVMGLGALYNAAQSQVGQWVYIPKLDAQWFRGGDFAKLRHWQLITQRIARRSDGSARVGWWCLTETGALFVQNRCEVSRYIWFVNNAPTRYSNETIDIAGSLGTRFDYRSLFTL
jgi:hypothetical protein